MINLLPPEVKQSISYARRNTRLRLWIVALVLSIAGIAAVIIAGQLYLQQSIHTYSAQVEQGNSDLKVQKLEETQKQVQDITNSLKLVVQVLSREILFSKLITQIGSALPKGSVLTGLSINQVQGGIDLQGVTTDYQTATQVQVNLQDPSNKIFDKADIITIQCSSDKTDDAYKAQYPCTLQLRALFAKSNPFSFISPSGATKP